VPALRPCQLDANELSLIRGFYSTSGHHSLRRFDCILLPDGVNWEKERAKRLTEIVSHRQSTVTGFPATRVAKCSGFHEVLPNLVTLTGEFAEWRSVGSTGTRTIL
jgi:hypothetical protein